MIYVPTSLENNNYCYTMLNTDIIREYKTTNINQDNDFTDYNTANHYSSYDGKEYLVTQPSCINQDDLTNEFYYRNDISHILIIFMILSFIIIYIPLRLLFRFYKRGHM